ncbi:MAG: DUF4149 domain-containing protein [Rugosibacter sp.]|jgi:hypothetical protein
MSRFFASRVGGLRLGDSLSALIAAIWLGSQMAIGYIAAPVLFSKLADRALAGELAGAMFTVMAWVSIVCGGFLLLYLLLTHARRAAGLAVFWLVVGMLLMTIAGHFGLRTEMARLKQSALPLAISSMSSDNPLRVRFGLLHGVSSGLYLMQTLMGVALVVLQARSRKPGGGVYAVSAARSGDF